ncbi:SPOR domain-containing protein [Methylocucumis oryzae]|uniref:SPOR domain-containing protein n=1 Tax=Methylocucumis oryzae TaxID=1632867 RepID=UPI0006983599|nr:SPOR domain-containing protein [Methylocucumis oryzae]
MNKELSQRIIGAIVVTALAAIFIPMLFDEPVEEAAPVVSQLPIPSGPTGASEEMAQPSPEAPVEAGQPESVTTTETTPAADDKKILSEDEQAAIESEGEEQEFSANPAEEAGDNETPQLDTGVVDETEPPVAVTPPPAKPVQKEVVKPVAKPQVKPQPTKPVAKPSTTVAKPVVTPVAPVAPAKTKPAATASSGGRWYIQAGSFSQKENALALSESLRKQGMPVKLETIQVSGKGTFYRLKVGPELDKNRALTMKSTLDQQRIKTLLIAE